MRGGKAMIKFLSTSLASVAAVVLIVLLPDSTWAEIGALPAHPLITHSVVILLPLLAVLLIVGIFKRKLLRKFHLYLIPILAAITGTVIAANSSGKSLSKVVGLPQKHAEWGENLLLLSLILLATLIIYSFFAFYKRSKTFSRALGAILVLLCLASIVLTYLVGHSGAESVWKYKYSSLVEQAELAENG